VTFNRLVFVRAALLISVLANLTILSSHIKADTGSCGGATTTLPFTDVQGNLFFLSDCRRLLLAWRGKIAFIETSYFGGDGSPEELRTLLAESIEVS
jgi:hypothetical protein